MQASYIDNSPSELKFASGFNSSIGEMTEMSWGSCAFVKGNRI